MTLGRIWVTLLAKPMDDLLSIVWGNGRLWLLIKLRKNSPDLYEKNLFVVLGSRCRLGVSGVVRFEVLWSGEHLEKHGHQFYLE